VSLVPLILQELHHASALGKLSGGGPGVDCTETSGGRLFNLTGAVISLAPSSSLCPPPLASWGVSMEKGHEC
jgi:hypothetical protein